MSVPQPQAKVVEMPPIMIDVRVTIYTDGQIHVQTKNNLRDLIFALEAAKFNSLIVNSSIGGAQQPKSRVWSP